MSNKGGNYNILIKFNDWSRERIMKGGKLATTRTKRHGSVGDCFQVASKWFRITSIKKVSLGVVAERFYAVEGAVSSEEFKAVWISIHPRACWTPDKLVYIHFFESVDSGYDTGSKGVVSEIRDIRE